MHLLIRLSQFKRIYSKSASMRKIRSVRYNVGMPSFFGPPKEVSSTNASAIKFAVEYGKTFQQQYGSEIKRLFLSGHGPHQIVDELKLRRDHPLVNDKTLANAVSRALTGYDGDLTITTMQVYAGLLSQSDYEQMQAQQHSGRSITTALERWSSDPQRWSPEEVERARFLTDDPDHQKPKSLFHPRSPHYDAIAKALNQQFHGGEAKRNGNSVKIALARYK